MATHHNTAKWTHYRAKLSKAEMVIELIDLAEFRKFAIDQHVRSIYSFMRNGQVEQFGLSHKGGLLKVDASGYTDLNDYQTATEKGFEDASSYYDAVRQGFDNHQAYLLAKGTELSDPETYRTMQHQGYINGFDEYQRLKKEGATLTDLGIVDNPYDLYRKGIDGGFDNWFELLVAIEKGFADAATYRSASSLGYPDSTSYNQGMEGDFVNATDWKLALEAGCFSRIEFRSKADLDALQGKSLAHDARVLIILLSKLPQERTIPIDKVQKLLESQLELYQDHTSKQFRPWFTTQLHSRDKILQLLREEPRVKEFGSYHHDVQAFVTHRLQDRKVVLDGSNVAYNSHGNDQSIPTVENMQRMVQELTRRGFKHIEVIVDASLKHRLSDKEKLEDFQKSVPYTEVPPNTSADLLVIHHVKVYNCLMVSNDLFREWKQVDPWIADNIEFYRITFRITDTKIVLPELDK